MRAGGEGVVDREGREEGWWAVVGGWRGEPVNHVKRTGGERGEGSGEDVTKRGRRWTKRE